MPWGFMWAPFLWKKPFKCQKTSTLFSWNLQLEITFYSKNLLVALPIKTVIFELGPDFRNYFLISKNALSLKRQKVEKFKFYKMEELDYVTMEGC